MKSAADFWVVYTERKMWKAEFFGAAVVIIAYGPIGIWRWRMLRVLDVLCNFSAVLRGGISRAHWGLNGPSKYRK